MTITDKPSPADQAPRTNRHRRGWWIAAAALLLAAGTGTGLAVALTGSPQRSATSASTTGYPPGSMRDYYNSMMGRYRAGGGGMMGGGSYGWMMGSQGYAWMMGGTAAPGWMNGDSVPGFMMGSNTDPSKVMGSLLADAPGPRVSTAQATALGNQTPAGATVDQAANTVTFTGTTVDLTVLASPASGKDLTFRIAGLVNPTISVPTGTNVTMTLINADPDMAHGVTITDAAPPYSWMPMMAATPAFPDASIWFLGDPTSAGMHEATVQFSATSTGTYYYICAVPGHAQKGMYGTFTVS